jgi:hypothetical protein
MGYLSREVFLAAASRLPRKTLQFDDLGGEVIVQGLTGAQRDDFEQWMFRSRTKNKDVNLQNIRARLVSLCLIDEDGQRLVGSVEDLGSIRADVLERLFDEARRLSGMTQEDVDELGKPLP